MVELGLMLKQQLRFDFVLLYIVAEQFVLHLVRPLALNVKSMRPIRTKQCADINRTAQQKKRKKSGSTVAYTNHWLDVDIILETHISCASNERETESKRTNKTSTCGSDG